MSRQLRMQVRAGDESAKPEESAIVAVGGEPDLATAPAWSDDFSDDDLLTLYREHARGSREQTAACEVLVSRCVPLVRACVRPYRAGLAGLAELLRRDPESPGHLTFQGTAPQFMGEVLRRATLLEQ